MNETTDKYTALAFSTNPSVCVCACVCVYVLCACVSVIFVTKIKTRSSVDADNGLEAFSGQSRSTNMVPFHMLHIVSYCAIVTFVFKRHRFYDIRLQKIS